MALYLCQEIPYPCLQDFRKDLFQKKDIDDHFGVQNDNSNITDWLTTSEVVEQFNMGATAIRAYAYRHNIPTKKEYGVI